ncbi:MAG: carbamoyltransferase HypF, partial [Acidobacteria bacterium]|nr:carbamoyltransferase HypF [Acidobacteriota bacterium]
MRVRVRGQVQGVGFRPFVYRLANELALSGAVRNDGTGVVIDVQGSVAALDAFVERLEREAPPLARIHSVVCENEPAASTKSGFVIAESLGGRSHTAITPDTAVCHACLEEFFDPSNRRYRYPLINCTHCGPRYTLTRALPYDRPNTSMAAFPMCSACRGEYDDPGDRRFHAQPTACARCGPPVTLFRPDRSTVDGDACAQVLACIEGGEIVAVKGLGGFHLVCDACNVEAVSELRRRKRREEKPFAVMVAGPASLASLVDVDDHEAGLLASPERPIVLLHKRDACDALLKSVAPGLAWLGVMLPYTPLQYLLFHEAAGRPDGTAWLEAPQPLVLVMTSANPHDEPLVIGNGEAFVRLAGIADAFLMHDREILVRCDDSVARHGAAAGDLRLTRRARGYTPQAIRLDRAYPPTLALGALLKNTICVVRDDEAFLSQHLGDLDNAPNCTAFERTVDHLLRVLEVEPAIVAHDLHPDFHSTRLALRLAAERAVPSLAIQHHHAHIAAITAEHRVDGHVLGLALDGVGLGEGGGIWGGELLRVDAVRCQRVGHVVELKLPGGDAAAREPWRMAAAALHAIGRGDDIGRRFPGHAGEAVREMLDKGVRSPATSSMGRWFDAVAGWYGIKPKAAFEGQAAMLLEGLAEQHGPADPLTDAVVITADNRLDLRPLFARLLDIPDAARGAAVFHATLAAALAEWAGRAAHVHGTNRVALGGGCFLNHVLGRTLRTRLAALGLEVLEARLAPPNDGGIALGQAWLA